MELEPGVVAGGQVGGSPRTDPFQEPAELDVPIAEHAGIRGAPSGVFQAERTNNGGVKLSGEIDDEMRDAHPVGDAPCRGHRFQGTAGAFDLIQATIAAQSEGDSNHLMTLFLKKARDG
jgi:hypothetical protein